jgi:hypothetical protein
LHLNVQECESSFQAALGHQKTSTVLNQLSYVSYHRGVENVEICGTSPVVEKQLDFEYSEDFLGRKWNC